jgi:hypothetical protein
MTTCKNDDPSRSQMRWTADEKLVGMPGMDLPASGGNDDGMTSLRSLFLYLLHPYFDLLRYFPLLLFYFIYFNTTVILPFKPLNDLN